ncbi:ATP-binding cassette domain-containing protein [Nonomuraea polychroma]|uniref:ATP-binding cassette domain-containing protein n=1 Tax=Nonomuraea polychroma TaxID=46176 RepID=UPI003D91E412
MDHVLRVDGLPVREPEQLARLGLDVDLGARQPYGLGGGDLDVEAASIVAEMVNATNTAVSAKAENRKMRRLAREHLNDMGVNIPSVDVEVAKLSGGQRQAIAVARSVYSRSRVLLLDEPLAAMGAKEGVQILDLVCDLKSRGEVSIVIIAHNYAQVLEVCDRVNLLQHGSITFDKPTAQSSVKELTDLVVEEYRTARTGVRPAQAAPPADTP